MKRVAIFQILLRIINTEKKVTKNNTKLGTEFGIDASIDR